MYLKVLKDFQRLSVINRRKSEGKGIGQYKTDLVTIYCAFTAEVVFQGPVVKKKPETGYIIDLKLELIQSKTDIFANIYVIPIFCISLMEEKLKFEKLILLHTDTQNEPIMQRYDNKKHAKDSDQPDQKR